MNRPAICFFVCRSRAWLMPCATTPRHTPPTCISCAVTLSTYWTALARVAGGAAAAGASASFRRSTSSRCTIDNIISCQSLESCVTATETWPGKESNNTVEPRTFNEFKKSTKISTWGECTFFLFWGNITKSCFIISLIFPLTLTLPVFAM